MDFEQVRNAMVENQVRTWDVFDPAVLDVMKTVCREDFVPAAFRNVACADAEIPLGHGQVMLPPKVDGRILQALDLGGSGRILEIGTGSGYLTACLALLGGDVRSVDIHADFTEQARVALDQAGIDGVTLETLDASHSGWLQDSYDIIVITCALPELDPAWQAALKVGGRLFAIVGTGPMKEALLVTRLSDDGFAQESLFDTDAPTMVNAAALKAFQL